MIVDFEAGARATSELFQPVGKHALLLPTVFENRQGPSISSLNRGEYLPTLASPFTVSVYPQNELEPSRVGVEAHVHKIAILRSNAIGDLVFALPALNALRLAYPDAEIVLLGLPWHAEFLTGRPGPVDRVIVVPRSRGVREPADYEEDPQEMGRFFEQMQAEEFDLAIQMHGGGRFSNPFVKRLGARLTIGFRSPDAIPLDRWVPYAFYQLEVLRYLEVVSLVGATLTSLEPRVMVTENDLNEAESVFPPTGRPLAVLHPGAGDPRRRWPVEKFAALGNSLAWAGADIVVVGIERDKELVDAVVSSMAVAATDLCGKLTLNGLTGLLSRASVVVSNDSGPLHLAAAVGAPTVGIYWCGNMITAGPITRTRHRPSISWRLDCPVCGLDCTRNACEHTASFVADVPIEEVVSSALDLISLEQRPVGRPQLELPQSPLRQQG